MSEATNITHDTRALHGVTAPLLARMVFASSIFLCQPARARTARYCARTNFCSTADTSAGIWSALWRGSQLVERTYHACTDHACPRLASARNNAQQRRHHANELSMPMQDMGPPRCRTSYHETCRCTQSLFNDHGLTVCSMCVLKRSPANTVFKSPRLVRAFSCTYRRSSGAMSFVK